MLTVASESFSCVAGPIQYAAITAYNGGVEIDSYVSGCIRASQYVTNQCHKRFVDAGIACATPKGGFYLFPDFGAYRANLEKRGVVDSKTFCQALLQETGVAILPGVAFGRPAAELTTRIALVDFDGTKALDASSEAELHAATQRTITAIEAVIAWVKK
jgi:aspartate aminotransferase